MQKLVLSLLAKVEQQAERIDVLEAENASLRAQLSQNSRNSSLPPSRDRFKVKPAFPKGSSGKKGGQQGHSGKTLHMSQHPDQIIELAAPEHCSCGADLSQVEPVLKATRQVFDLPQPRLEVSEYRLYERCCPNCRAVLHRGFPRAGDSPCAVRPWCFGSMHVAQQQFSPLLQPHR